MCFPLNYHALALEDKLAQNKKHVTEEKVIFSADLRGLEKTKKLIQSLDPTNIKHFTGYVTSLIASLSMLSDVSKKLRSVGLGEVAKSYEKIIKSTQKELFSGYKSKASMDRLLSNPDTLKKLKETIGDVNTQIYRDISISNDMILKANDAFNKKNLKLQRQYHLQRAKDLAQEDKDLLKANQKRLAIESQIKNAVGINRTTVSGMSSKFGAITPKEVLSGQNSINSQLSSVKDMSARERLAAGYVMQLNRAGYSASVLAGKIKIATDHTMKFGEHVRRTVKDFFSMERLVGRISFVLTALGSYQIIQTIRDVFVSSFANQREFQWEMSKTYALLTDKSESVKQKLTKDVIAIAKEYRVNAKDISMALYEIVSASISATDATTVLRSAIKLSIGGFGDAQKSALALVEILNAYDMSASRAAYVTDVIFQATKVGIVKVEEFAGQVGKVIAASSAFGVSFEEISAAIATMTLRGIPAAQAFTALNQMLMTIANPTEEAKKTMDAYGVTLDMNTVRAKGLVTALMGMGEMLNSEEALTNIFKTRTGAKAVMSLTKGEESGQYSGILAGIYGASGSADAAVKERMKTIQSLLNDLTASWDKTMRDVGTSTEGMYRFVLKKVTALINGIDKNLNVLKRTMTALFAGLLAQSLPMVARLLASIYTSFRLFVLYVQSSGVKSAFVALGTTMKSAFGGVVTILALVGQWLYELAKRASDKRIEKALGAFGVDAMQKQVDLSRERNASDQAHLENLAAMIRQNDALYEAQKTNSKEAEAYKKIHEATVEQLKNQLGISVDIKKQKLGEYLVNAENELIKAKKTALMVELQMQALTLVKDMSDATKKSKIFSQTVMAQSVNSNAIMQAIMSGNINSAKPFARGISSRQTSYDMNQKGGMEANQAENALQMLASIVLGFTDIDVSGFNKMKVTPGAIETGASNVIDFAEKYKDFINTVLDYQVETKSIKKLTDINNELNANKGKAKGAINNIAFIAQIISDIGDIKDISKDKVSSIEEITKNKTAMQTIFDFATSNQSELSSGLDSAVKEGSISQSQANLILDGYRNSLSELAVTIAEYDKDKIRQLIQDEKTKTGKASLSQSFISASGGSAGQYEMMSTPALKNELSNNPALDESYKPFIQGLIDTRDNEYSNSVIDFLASMGIAGVTEKDLNLNSLPELFDSIDSILQKNGIDANMKDIIRKFNKNVSSTGRNFDLTDKQKAEIVSTVMSKANPSMSDWTTTDVGNEAVGAFGISITADDREKHYRDVLNNVEQNAIALLDKAWTNYYDMKVKHAEEAKDKILAILAEEQRISLSNENLSAQQRESLTAKYEERKRKITEAQDKKISALKKKQALANLDFEFAKSVALIWANEIASKSFAGLITAGVLTALLGGVFAIQRNQIEHTTGFAEGGYTGTGSGQRDETGYRPAGIVHEGELVVDKKTLDRNFEPMMNMYSYLKKGGGFGDFMAAYINGQTSRPVINTTHSFASGGYAKSSMPGSTNINVNFKGIRVLDTVDLAVAVEDGNRRRKVIK